MCGGTVLKIPQEYVPVKNMYVIYPIRVDNIHITQIVVVFRKLK